MRYKALKDGNKHLTYIELQDKRRKRYDINDVKLKGVITARFANPGNFKRDIRRIKKSTTIINHRVFNIKYVRMHSLEKNDKMDFIIPINDFLSICKSEKYYTEAVLSKILQMYNQH
jgi:hypothetical protein